MKDLLPRSLIPSSHTHGSSAQWSELSLRSMDARQAIGFVNTKAMERAIATILLDRYFEHVEQMRIRLFPATEKMRCDGW